ncbi:hypothetical protein BKA70DRAFT_1539383 [Coprinopsis sp. MPI-PUGE-AT-0042]|nr:hypothetical protein BKA70DRAFT_1539383 [Coprinopsis sp. MPI-PUGE-AT-0042]
MKLVGVFALFALALPAVAVPVLRIPTGNSTAKLDSFVESLDLNIWTHSVLPNLHLDVEVPKDLYKTFTSGINKLLKEEGITYPIEVMHEDLGVSILKEAEGIVTANQFTIQAGLANQAWFNAYHPYADHLQFLSDLVTTFPNNAKLVTSGTSVGGRTIQGINIFGSSGSGTKPAIIWHGNVHAREWITSMTPEYLAYTLLNNYANSTEIKGYVDKYDFYIFPVVNPDGFVFSQTSTRLWRKNRQAAPSGSTCLGRDINHNWNVQWSQTTGASTNPCAEDFKGRAAADAPETQGLQAFVNAHAQSAAGAKMYVDWHSYSQLFMYPYGYL